MNSEFQKAPELEIIARKLVLKFDRLAHVEVDKILFLSDIVGRPKGIGARCYSVDCHPMQFFTNHEYVIVFYEMNIDYMTEAQRIMLLYHEMRHIGRGARKLVDHNVKDFYDILRVDVSWAHEGVEVPNLLEEGSEI